MIALSCALLAAVPAGCDEAPEPGQVPRSRTTSATAAEKPVTGTTKIEVDGRSVSVSCSGAPAEGRPVVVLLSGLGDDLATMAAFQKTLSEKERVCSYDRLGQGTSDQPEGPQSFDTTGRILTEVLDRVAGGGPVVLAGHSLGGLIAARYAPDHQDKVKGLVLMDATPPTTVADTKRLIPGSATGPGADLLAQTVAVYGGQNPEKLVMADGPVAAAGDIPVEVIRHGQRYLAAAVPGYGAGLEQAWAQGQRAWLELSSDSELSTADRSGHYIYVDQPDVAVRAIERVVTRAGRS